jgi:hypothetical protein
MDDRYDDNGNAESIIINSVLGEVVPASNVVLTARERKLAGTQKRLLSASYTHVRTQMYRFIDRMIAPLFATTNVLAHYSVMDAGSWDGTVLGWLIAGELRVIDKDYVHPREFLLSEYNRGETILKVQISLDRRRQLSTSHDSKEFACAIEGVKSVLECLHSNVKLFDFDRADHYTVLKYVEAWIKLPLVERHVRDMVGDFVLLSRATP